MSQSLFFCFFEKHTHILYIYYLHSSITPIPPFLVGLAQGDWDAPWRLRFDFLVTPGPMVITRSLVEGFPSELTAGKLSCWNITLRDVAWMQEVTQKRPWRVCLERVR